jgi:hypothetical protein
VHARLEGWAHRCGTNYHLTKLDTKGNVAESMSSALLAGFSRALDIPATMLACKATMKAVQLAKRVALGQLRPCVSLERPEQISACKELFRVSVGGDHRTVPLQR